MYHVALKDEIEREGYRTEDLSSWEPQVFKAILELTLDDFLADPRSVPPATTLYRNFSTYHISCSAEFR